MLNLATPLIASLIALTFMATWAIELKRSRDFADDADDFAG